MKSDSEEGISHNFDTLRLRLDVGTEVSFLPTGLLLLQGPPRAHRGPSHRPQIRGGVKDRWKVSLIILIIMTINNLLSFPQSCNLATDHIPKRHRIAGPFDRCAPREDLPNWCPIKVECPIFLTISRFQCYKEWYMVTH